ncbi:MAG: lactonase family protein [bacterium]
MADKHYVAYVGTYTHGTSKGIHIYDVNVEEGLLFLRRVVPVNNSSYLTCSRNGKVLYTIADEGVEAFQIEEDGDLTPINAIDIDGMRGCHLSTSINGKYLFVAGYHDGKVTVVHTHHDGQLGRLLDGVFHRGQGAINERCFRPHVCCVRVTPDDQYLCAVDEALDQILIYKIHPVSEKLQLVDILRMGREVAPRSIHFSKDGRYAYVLCQITNTIRVYKYFLNEHGRPEFNQIQEVSTLSNARDPHDAASSLRLSYDGAYVFCSTAGDDSIGCFKIDPETGLLTKVFALPISGDYPKDIALFPDQKHIAVVNNGSNTITTFTVDYEKKTLAMKGRPQKLDKPNCMIFHEIEKAPATIRNISEKEAEAEVQKPDRLIRPVERQ